MMNNFYETWIDKDSSLLRIDEGSLLHELTTGECNHPAVSGDECYLQV